MRVRTTILLILILSSLGCAAHADNGSRAILQILKLIEEASKASQQKQAPERHDPAQAPNYKLGSVSGIRVGQKTDPLKKEFRGFDCAPSSGWVRTSVCERHRSDSEPRGKYEITERYLESEDYGIFFVEKRVAPAFWSSTEVQEDIDRISKTSGGTPSVEIMPSRKGLPDSVMAKWGSLTLKPFSPEEIESLRWGGEIGDQVIADFQNNVRTSAAAYMPVFKVQGTGMAWIATFGRTGIGTLRYFVADLSFAPEFISQPLNSQRPQAFNDLRPEQPHQEDGGNSQEAPSSDAHAQAQIEAARKSYSDSIVAAQAESAREAAEKESAAKKDTKAEISEAEQARIDESRKAYQSAVESAKSSTAKEAPHESSSDKKQISQVTPATPSEPHVKETVPAPTFSDGLYYLVAGVIGGILGGIAVIYLYFLPSIYAFKRAHPNRWIIFAINLLAGVTILGWVLCLLWALRAFHVSPTGSNGGESGLNLTTNDTKRVSLVSASDGTGTTLADQLLRLHELKERGVLSDEEFQLAKKKLVAIS